MRKSFVQVSEGYDLNRNRTWEQTFGAELLIVSNTIDRLMETLAGGEQLISCRSSTFVGFSLGYRQDLDNN